MFAKLLMGLAAVALAGHAAAQAPASPASGRPLRLVVSSAPGGFNDVVGRIVAAELAGPAANGQHAIVDNKPGGGGILAAQYAMNSAADGHTILLADTAITSIIPVLGGKPPFDSLRDFTPVSKIVTAPLFLAVNTGLGAATLEEFVALAKARPCQLSYGSSGPGSVHHLAFETLKAKLGIDVVHIPYKSSGISIPALLAGDIQVLFTSLGPVLPHVRSGKVRLLGVASPQRSAKAPEVPSFAERGVGGLVLEVSLHALVPAGTPQATVARLSEELRRAAHQPEALRRFDAVGMDPVGGTPEQSLAELKAEHSFYARAVKLSGARATD